MKTKSFFISILALFFLVFIFSIHANALGNESMVTDTSDIKQKRMLLYKNMELLYNIPWYYIAAIDQFERNISKDKQKNEKLIGITFTKQKWAGLLHPDPEDQNPGRIKFFNGLGIDGNGDGKADITNDIDIIVAYLTYISRYGNDEESIRMALTEYYNDQSAKIITEIAAIYKHLNTTELSERVFPIPKWNNYSYRSTWGDTRGWGGVRIHEGTDIFASYGTPVRSVSYGYVEILGWNQYGGWRVGIRGDNNIYYYYAHLSGYEKGLKEGNIVVPGDVIGYVGSSGYGPPGTQGKFPPHLHFGMYKYGGKYEWSFDPTPYLRIWERRK